MNRMTVVEQIYHQADSLPPKALPSNYGRMLETDEAPYGRPNLVVEQEWVTLETGWLKDSYGVLSLSNKTTNSEKSSVLEVRLGDSPYYWLVRPEESMRAEPSCPVSVRCREGSAKISYTFFPK